MGLLCFIFRHHWDYGHTQAEVQGRQGQFVRVRTRMCSRCEKLQHKSANNKWKTIKYKKNKIKKPNGRPPKKIYRG